MINFFYLYYKKKMNTENFQKYLNFLFNNTAQKCDNQMDQIDFKVVQRASVDTNSSSGSSSRSGGSSSIYQNDSNRAVYGDRRNMERQNGEQLKRLRSTVMKHERNKTLYDKNLQQTNRLKEGKKLVDMELANTKLTLNKLRRQNERLKNKPQPVQPSSLSSPSASLASRPVDNTEQIDRLKGIIAHLQRQKIDLLGMDKNRQAIFSKLKECQDMKRKDFEKNPRMFKIISQIELILKTGLIDGNIRKKLTAYIEEQITSNESDVGEKLKFYEKYQENEDILRNLYEVSSDQMTEFENNSDPQDRLREIKRLLDFEFTETVTERVLKNKWVTEDREKTFNLLRYINTYIRKGTKVLDLAGNKANVERIISVNKTLKTLRGTYISDLQKVDFKVELEDEIKKGKLNLVPPRQKEQLADCLGQVRDFILSQNAMEYNINKNRSVETRFYDLETKANYFQVLNNTNDPTEMSFVKDKYFFNIYLDPEGILKESEIIKDIGLKWTQESSSGFNLNDRLKKHIENLEENPKKKWFKRDSEFFTITEQGATTSSSNTESNEIIIQINGYMDKIINIVNENLPTKLVSLQKIVENTSKTEEEKTQEISTELGLSMEGGYHDMNLVNKRFLHLLKCALEGKEYTIKSDDYIQLIKDCEESFVNLDYNQRVAFCEGSKKEFIRRKKESLGMKSDLEFAYMGINFLDNPKEIRDPDAITEAIKEKMTAAELDRERILFEDLREFRKDQDQGYGQWKRKQQESQRNRGGRGGLPGGGRGPNPFGGNPFAGRANALRKVKKQQGEGNAGGNRNAVSLSTSSTSSTRTSQPPLSIFDAITAKRID